MIAQSFEIKASISKSISYYVSVNSKPDHPPGRPSGIRTFSLPPGGSGFRPTFFARGGRGFELEKFSTVLKKKCKNFSICFKKPGGSLKSRCSCAVSYQFFAKNSRCLLYRY